MAVENPNQGRATINDNGYGLEIIIPSRKNYFIIVFMCAWLGGWFMGESFAISELSKGLTEGFGSGVDGGIDAFLLFWLIAWTVGGIVVIGLILWQIVGKEEILLTMEGITIRHRVFVSFRVKTYLLSDVKNFRQIINPTDDSIYSLFRIKALEQFTGKRGTLAFDYGMKTVRFAAAIDEAEAGHIVGLFKERGIGVL